MTRPSHYALAEALMGYALSILADGTTRLDYTTYAAGATSVPEAIPVTTFRSGSGCDGYGISLANINNSYYLGVLWKSATSLYLATHSVTTSTPTPLRLQ